jgi:hypothetical protein
MNKLCLLLVCALALIGPKPTAAQGLRLYQQRIEFQTGPKREVFLEPHAELASRSPCTIVVAFQVDRLGKVTRAEVEQQSTTCTDTVLCRQASALVQRYEFTPAPDAPEVQHGRMSLIIESRPPVVVMEESPPSNAPRLVNARDLAPEDQPQFPGGMKAMDRFIEENLHYPEAAKSKGWKTTVILTFIVEIDGSFSDVRVREAPALEDSYEKEALRVLGAMPTWQPGRLHGVPVRTFVRQTFLLRS